VLVTDDLESLHLPILDMAFSKLHVKLSNWSTDLVLDSNVTFVAKSFNLHNSHWEPLVESCSLSLNVGILIREKNMSTDSFYLCSI
jgi:hypothetical protein